MSFALVLRWPGSRSNWIAQNWNRLHGTYITNKTSGTIHLKITTKWFKFSCCILLWLRAFWLLVFVETDLIMLSAVECLRCFTYNTCFEDFHIPLYEKEQHFEHGVWIWKLEIWYFAINFLVEKYFYLCFRHCLPHQEKSFWSPLEKSFRMILSVIKAKPTWISKIFKFCVMKAD